MVGSATHRDVQKVNPMIGRFPGASWSSRRWTRRCSLYRNVKPQSKKCYSVALARPGVWSGEGLQGRSCLEFRDDEHSS
jgi:hypothetical protein